VQQRPRVLPSHRRPRPHPCSPASGYWQAFSFGELAETALSSYKIHLGSAGILIEPDDRYLSIVPATSRTTAMLPFDEVLNLSQLAPRT